MRVDLVRSLGAGEVIDYTREDFSQRGETYGVGFDAVGKRSFALRIAPLYTKQDVHRPASLLGTVVLTVAGA